MKVLAHRGDTRHFGDNTLKALKAALQCGYSLEVDIRLTADDRFVLHHDASLPKNEETNIQDLKLEKIKNISNRKDNRGRSIPTLEEAIKLFAELKNENVELGLHLKDYNQPGIERKLINRLYKINRNYPSLDLFDCVFVFDMLIDNAKRFAKNEADLRVGLSVGESSFFPDKRHPTIYDYKQVHDLSCVDIIWADEWLGTLYSKELVEKCKEQEQLIYCVSPELHDTTDPMHPKHNQYEECWDLLTNIGVDGICTDNPAKFTQSQL